MTDEAIQKIADLVSEQTIICTKEVLTAAEVARYTGLSMSYLYKLTQKGEIPHYKPTGNRCYFNRVEVEEWLQSNRCATAQEINDRANRMMMEKGGVR